MLSNPVPQEIPDNSSQGKLKDSASFYIAEYNSLRQEQISRMQTQHQAFNFLLIVMAAAITAVITAAGANNREHLPWVVIAVALMLPLAACPLGYIFFDNEIMIHAIGSYLYYSRRRSMIELAGDQGAFERFMPFARLPSVTRKVFPWISKGRWILFCLPTFPLLIFSPLIVWLLWPICMSNPALAEYPTGVGVVIIVSWIIVYVLDIWACLVLGMAIWWTYKNDNFQRSQENPSV